MPTLQEFDVLPEPERSSLFYLRGLRDQIADSICADSSGFEKHVEAMIAYDYESSAYHFLRTYYAGNNYFGALERLQLFRRLCLRIARIERERCRCHIPSNLQTA